MNKSAIKTFAIEARKKLIASVRDKAGRIGITKDRITDPISKGEGYAIFPTHIGIEAKLTGQEVKQRENLVNRINSKENGYELVMEEAAYTWFNRLIAIRFMEVNDYLPSRVRVLSSETAGKFEPDIVTQAPDIYLEFSQAEIDEIFTLKEKNAMDQLFRLLFIKQCNELGKMLPELFENTSKENNDYTEILLDISYTNEDGVLRDLLKIDEADFLEAVEIIGWLYQYYNTEPKDETFTLLKKNVKITKERIPAATQLFTPDWIVRYMVENSLGRLWLEGHPDSDIKGNWKYYLDEAEQEEHVKAELDTLREERKNLRPEDIKVIDPCMGSGHILVYAFDVLMDIYKSCGYTERDAAKLILQHNLYGLDIDDRAYQLAYFAVMMKARSYNRRILSLTSQEEPLAETDCFTPFAKTGTVSLRGAKRRGSLSLNLCAIQESNGIPKQEVMDIFARLAEGPLWSDKLKCNIEYLIDVFTDAKEYGSILEIKPIDFAAIEEAVEVIREDKTILNIFEAPYRDMILERLPILVAQGKLLSQKYDVVVTNPPYMGINNGNGNLNHFVKKFYPDSKSDLFAVFIEKCGKMTKKDYYWSMVTQHSWMFLSSFEKLREKLQDSDTVNMIHLGARAFEEIGGEVVQTASWVKRKSNNADYFAMYIRLVDYNSQQEKENAFLAKTNMHIVQRHNFSKISGMPIAYWASKKNLDAFISAKSLAELASPKKGLVTTDNNRFLKIWHEVAMKDVGIRFKSREKARDSKLKWFPINKGGEFRKWYGNKTYLVNWFNDGIEMKNAIVKKYKGGSYTKEIRSEDKYFCNSITWSALTGGASSFRYSDYGALFDSAGSSMFPLQHAEYMLGLLNTKVIDKLLGIINPTLNYGAGSVSIIPIKISEDNIPYVTELVNENVEISRNDWDQLETSWDFKKHPLLKRKTRCANLHNTFEKWKQFTEVQFSQIKANEEELNRIFIEIYGLQDELTPEVADKDITIRKADLQRDIRSFISYAVGCMFGRYSLDIEGLAYAGGAWDESKYTTFIPDTDNILPITDDEYFTDDIVIRLVEFVKVVYGQETLEENIDFIAEALGNRGTTSREIIRNYFLKDFYKDHIRIYQKRPIYWLFDSGKENGFKALIYMHRYDKDTVGRVRVDYLHKTQSFIENAIAHCDVVMESNAPASDKAKAVKQKEKLVKQLAETRLYDQAIAHIAHQRIAIDLDDGVVVNYAKLQGVEVANEGKKAVKVDLLAKI